MNIANIELESHTVDELIRSYCNITSGDTLNTLVTNYHVLLSIWSDDNGITTAELFDILDLHINDYADVKIECQDDTSITTAMNLCGTTIYMNWAI